MSSNKAQKTAKKITHHRMFIPAGVALGFITGLIATPGAPELPLSSTAPLNDAAATRAAVQEWTTEGKRLAREFERLEFKRTSLESAKKNLGVNGGDLGTQFDALAKEKEKYDAAMTKRNADVDAFHSALLRNPAISEQAAYDIYTKALEGSKYKHYYTEKFPYRDECRVELNLPSTSTATGSGKAWNDCMTEKNDGEGHKSFPSVRAYTAGGGFGFAGLMGLTALWGAAGRRNEKKKHEKSLSNMRDLLRPGDR